MEMFVLLLFILQERLAQSHQEQENLIQVVSELEGQLGDIKEQLDHEKHSCRYTLHILYMHMYMYIYKCACICTSLVEEDCCN